MKLRQILGVTIVTLAFAVAVSAEAKAKNSANLALSHDAIAGRFAPCNRHIPRALGNPHAGRDGYIPAGKQSRRDRRRESCGSRNEILEQRGDLPRECRWLAGYSGNPLWRVERSHRIQGVAAPGAAQATGRSVRRAAAIEPAHAGKASSPKFTVGVSFSRGQPRPATVKCR